jgi:hypothetical protein
VRGIFGAERDDITNYWENYILRSLLIGTAGQVLFSG